MGTNRTAAVYILNHRIPEQFYMFPLTSTGAVLLAAQLTVKATNKTAPDFYDFT